MSRTGVGTLVWIIYVVWLQTALATDCDTLVSGNVLDVASGTSCTIGADLLLPSVVVTVYGTITITVPKVAISVTDLEIKAGGIVSADAVSSSGPGAGNSHGSGGKWFQQQSKLHHLYEQILNEVKKIRC